MTRGKRKNPDRIDLVYLYIGQRIAEIREGLGMTQGELSEKCGFSRSVICMIELSRTHIAVDTLYKIAHALNVKVAILLPPDDLSNRDSTGLFRQFLNSLMVGEQHENEQKGN